jgi:uncharacterized protein YbjT (DUF2867 family)
MKVLIFGATGMVGQGVLREALLADDVTEVVTIGRTATRRRHSKLREVVHPDLLDYAAIEDSLQGFDACFFCLGASSAGLDEAAYTRINYDIPVAAARTLSRLNPAMTFVYVSGAGTGRQSAMWARVKRRTENALLAMPFKAAYMFRPGVIQPLNGARSKTPLYRALYVVISPVLPLARRLFPKYVLSTMDIGLAMLNAARRGAGNAVLEAVDIRTLSEH